MLDQTTLPPPWARPDPDTYPTLEGFQTVYGVPLCYIGDDGDIIALGHPGELRALAALRASIRAVAGAAEADQQLRWHAHPICTELDYTYARLRAHCDEYPDCGTDPISVEAGRCWHCAEIASHPWWLNYGLPADEPDVFPAVVFHA